MFKNCHSSRFIIKVILCCLCVFYSHVAKSEILFKQNPFAAFSGEYSNRFGLINGIQYANMIDPFNSLGLEIVFGANEFRLGSTWAHIIDHRHRLKITGEYLSENLSFDFVMGQRLAWNKQYTVGLIYQYFFQRPCLRSLDFSLYHSYARDESLPFQAFTVGDILITDYPFMAGSRSAGGGLGFTLHPCHGNGVNLRLLYDVIAYRNHHESAPDRAGFGAQIAVYQWLHPCFKISLSGSSRPLFNLYSADMSWLAYSRPGSHLQLKLFSEYRTGGVLPEPQETRIGLRISFDWNGCVEYEENVLWSTLPAIRMPQTLISRDEKFTQEKVGNP